MTVFGAACVTAVLAVTRMALTLEKAYSLLQHSRFVFDGARLQCAEVWAKLLAFVSPLFGNGAES